MKPKRYKPEFAVQAWVESESRRFVPPDLDTLPFVAQAGGAGGAPTVVVAASNSTDFSKGKADPGFTCLGTADQDVINGAIEAATGGRVLLCEGTYNLSGPINMILSTQLCGMGMPATVLDYSEATGPVINTEDNSTIRDLFIAGSNTDIGIGGGGNADLVRIERVWFGNVVTCINLSGNDWTITDCGDFTLGGGPVYFIRDQGPFANCKATNNHARGDIDMGAGISWVVANNVMEGAISADGGEGGVVADNVWVEAAVPSVALALIDIANCKWVAVTGNTMPETGGEHGIRFDTVDLSTITGNQIESGDINILLDSCTRVSVTGNRTQWSNSHNIFLDGSSDCVVVGNAAVAATGADNIRVVGDRNLIAGNTSYPSLGFSTADIGINVVSGNDNAVYANYLGDASAYGTADFADAGTGTMTAPGANGQFVF